MSVLPGAGPTDDSDGHASDDYTSDRYDVRWLDLRAAADDRSRAHALFQALTAELPPSGPHLLDVGAGTGAMQRWCDDRLQVPARWTLLDPDRQLLDMADGRNDGAVRCVQGSVRDLRSVLADRAVDAVVCSALLDVLPRDDIAALVQATSEAKVPLLAALTVTGEVELLPADSSDAAAAVAARARAGRGGAAGPVALAALRSAAALVGASVQEQATPWLLAPGQDDELLREWTAGYVASALAGGGGATPDLHGWAEDRRRAVAAGRLHVTVGHVDVLVVPG